MKSTEIKIKRQELMSVAGIPAMLRKMADQIEAEHLFRLDEYPITLANYAYVHQKFEKKGREHFYKLSFTWEEELADQSKLDDDTPGERNVNNTEELPEDTDLPPAPLDLPGTDGEQPRMRG